VERQAVVAEVRLGHKEGGSCDPSTQEDAGRAPAAQLLRGHAADAIKPLVRDADQSVQTAAVRILLALHQDAWLEHELLI
jgi:hypothetical protein